MYKRFLIAGASALAAALLLWIWIGYRHDTAEVSTAGAPRETAAASAEPGNQATPYAQAVVETAPIKPPPPASRPAASSATEALPTMSKPETPPAAGNPIESYLTKHGRDARSLLQAFRTSKNKDYLIEALERYPDDPMVLFHGVLYDTEPSEERKAILQRLQKLLPDDAVPCYLLGEQLLQEGDTKAALELLMAGSLKPHANNYVNEMISDAREFLAASGVTPDEALAQACINVEMRLLTPIRHLLLMVKDIHADISASGDVDKSARTWAITGARIAQSLNGQMNQYLVDTLSSTSIEKKFLAILPPETELVAGGMTVAQRTKEIEDFRALLDSLPLGVEAAFVLPPEEKLMFFRKVQEEDEISALLWLNKRDQKQENQVPSK